VRKEGGVCGLIDDRRRGREAEEGGKGNDEGGQFHF